MIAKNAGEWQIVVMHNLDLTALPPSNSRNSATTNHEREHIVHRHQPIAR